MNLQLARVRLIRIFIFIVVVVSEAGFASIVNAREQVKAQLDQFEMMDESSGWILLESHLFWTSDVGQSWEEIGPSVPSTALVQDVEFIDPNTGWMLWTTANDDGTANYALAQTPDHGRTWNTHDLTLFESGDVSAQFDKAGFGWVDAQSGWVAVKQASSSNFSLGTLFRTSDGGASWTRSIIPTADHVSFNDPRIGWATGSNQIFITRDGGSTWKNVTPSDSSITTYQPFHADGQAVIVAIRPSVQNNLGIYTFSSTDQWSLLGQVPRDVEPGIIGLSILDSQNLVAVIPETNSIVRMQGGVFAKLENQDGLSASIIELDMASLDVGWARAVDSNCTAASSSDLEPASVSCTSLTRLLHTTDGGLTWQGVELPYVESSLDARAVTSIRVPMISTANFGNTSLFVGQGFDKCEIPTISQLQTWAYPASPYGTVNLYIGGSSRACSNSALSLSYLETLNQQGWKFIPTWVGPQAPCTGYLSRMSYDPLTAYNEGVNEANLAVERLSQLGLTFPDKTGSVVYYDIEYYGTNTTCREAVNSFMNGWVTQLHARGTLAGVYGSTLCNTALSDFRSIPNVPDAIWPARWYHNLGSGFYDPTATVWDLGSCLPNTVWNDHQRIRQYEGDHDETWGGLTLGIDSNVLDGVVAKPYLLPYVRSVSLANPSPTNASNVNFTVTFSEVVTGVDMSNPFDDFTLVTTGVSGASITNVSGSGSVYTVAVNTGAGDGTIRLDVLDHDNIKDASNNPLGGTGNGNGAYSNGAVYVISKSPTPTPYPGIVSHARSLPTSTPVYLPSTATPYTPTPTAVGMLTYKDQQSLQGQSAVVSTSTPMPEMIMPTNSPQTFSAEIVNPASTPQPVSAMGMPDVTAPETSFLITPGSINRQRSALFVYESTESGTFVCSLDGSAYFACGHSIRFTGLSDGVHLFEVRVVDDAGNYEKTPVQYTWVIERRKDISRFRGLKN